MLKIVSVDGEAIPDATLADELQDLTDNIEPDAAGVISVVVLADGSLRIAWCGGDYSSYELMGLFEAAVVSQFQLLTRTRARTSRLGTDRSKRDLR